MPKNRFHTFVYLIAKKVIRLIIEEENMTELDAIQSFYQSEGYDLLAQEETKYWWFSPWALYDEYVEEKRGGEHV